MLRPDHVEAVRLADVAARVPGVRLSPPGRPGPATSPAQSTRSPVRSSAPGDTDVTGVTNDSRQVRPGDLYAALPGERADGARFVPEAAAAGAVAVLGRPGTDTSGLPLLSAPDPRGVLGAVSAAVFGDPSADLRVLGVTGTNGKTTVAWLLEAGLRAAGEVTGLLGTIAARVGGAGVPGTTLPSVRTTPEAPEVQALLAVVRERGGTAAAMEVSSHALASGRVDGVHFAGVGFTNLGRDHLDFHHTLEEYFEAKARLFEPGRARVRVVDVDGPWGRRLADRLAAAGTSFVTCGLSSADAAWRALDVACGPRGSTFRLRTPSEQVDVAVALPGLFNVANAVLALALLVETGTPLEDAVRGIGALDGVPGRMEAVDAGQPFTALVDFAHTPDALRGLLSALRPLATGRVLIVVGAGGDRDRDKRPLMGAAAAEGADVVVVTDDNPRSEDPAAIRAQVLAGARAAAAAEVHEVGDRQDAVRAAARLARPGDVLVVAGKGHETGQELGGRVTPFDDRTVLRAELQRVAAGAGARPVGGPDGGTGADGAAR